MLDSSSIASFAEMRRIVGEFPGPDRAAAAKTTTREAVLTKPAGALARLEEVTLWLATWQAKHPPSVDHPRVAVFAGNHGVAALGVSAFPADVTKQMVLNFTSGGAAVNQLAKNADADLRVYEMALDNPTQDFTQKPAMSESEAANAMAYGMMCVEPGIDLLALGEMGIANTTSASAMAAALFGGTGSDWAGPGTGVHGAQLSRKAEVIDLGLARHKSVFNDPLQILQCLGGHELAAITGAVMAARMARVPVLLDGFASTVAASILLKLDPGALDHCLVAHCSAEPGHRRLLDHIGKKPLLEFGMRLGEASGAALAIPLVRAAALCHSGMASFAEAGVSGKDLTDNTGMSNEFARAFLLDRLGLRGPLWSAGEAQDQALRLGMIQIDSIRVCGLRNHEIAWASRTDAPVASLYDLFYKKRVMLETHYPIFATRRDWLPWFLKDFDKTISNRDRLKEMRPVMRRVLKHIAANGPASPGDFESEQVQGGFNTIKATTKALEYLFALGKVQISGRTPHFHRLFDLTERVAPELATPPATWRQDRDSFFVHSALSVLKLATPEQLAGRVAHHIGTWRGGGLPMARRLVAKAREDGLIDVLKVQAGETTHDYLALKSELDAFRSGYKPSDDTVRLIPPLDNLMFSRRRFTEMFGFTYKFEAYTPQHQRQFYFALPIVYRDEVVGLLDAKKDEGIWQVRGLQVRKPVPAEHLRNAVLRLARVAGAEKVKSGRKIPAEYRKSITGMCV